MTPKELRFGPRSKKKGTIQAAVYEFKRPVYNNSRQNEQQMND